jgi:hypothetical protein
MIVTDDEFHFRAAPFVLWDGGKWRMGVSCRGAPKRQYWQLSHP